MGGGMISTVIGLVAAVVMCIATFFVIRGRGFERQFFAGFLLLLPLFYMGFALLIPDISIMGLELAAAWLVRHWSRSVV
ncbi:MAG: hypothetical protein ACJAX5_002651 [Patiriisocius sp.]|jgi:hypothetical protein